MGIESISFCGSSEVEEEKGHTKFEFIKVRLAAISQELLDIRAMLSDMEEE